MADTVTHEPAVAEFRTSDIYFAGYIIASGEKMTKADKEKDGRKIKTIFVFSLPESRVSDLKSGFFGGAGMVNATQYMFALKNLKSLCFV